MADIMRPVPFSELFERISGELRNQKSIFSIKEEKFFHPGDKKIKVFSQYAKTPLGPAAGPHTQLAQNIITSFLVGARFIELKTTQILDSLEIAKPCIDARDEGYNTEWSTELSLDKAYDEYLKAYFILHALDIAMSDNWKEPSFIFNMSVGYNLEGIKSSKMQKYINSMIDAKKSELFEDYKAQLKAIMEEDIFEGTIFEGKEKDVIKNIDKISANISPSVTLSTMHGCPPDEIEAICNYMLSEKGLDTFVKLNPTLLGYDEVREVLNSLGFDYLTLKRESFEHDLQYSDAIGMLSRLREVAKKNNKGFGVKLTNTLGSVNDQGMLPGDEMYASGRALMPLSLSVALRLSKEFDGTLPISYSGGVTSENVKELFESGIRPITIATDMLQPGGYYRMLEDANILESLPSWEADKIDVGKLETLCLKAKDPKGFSSKGYKGYGSIKLNRPLPLLDCFVAPCVEACPIHQMVPDYVNLAGEGREAEALALIYLDNALPNITGWICNHECQNHCTRKDYEGPVKIREVKRRLAESAFDEYKGEIWSPIEEEGDVKAAVIGAGPAGLSAAYFLSRAGFAVSVFEKDKKAGGVVSSTIPGFRIPEEVVARDVDFIKEHGVEFNFNTKKSIKELKAEGYEYIFVAIGAEKSRDGGVSGNGKRESAIKFLRDYKNNKANISGNVVVVGAGNTAMDASRALKRLGAVESVNIVYRRSFSEMPADHEEYEEALAEGIKFNWLRNPKDFTDGILTLSVMELGEKDSSGRRRPVDTGKIEEIKCDYLIFAIGESVSDEELNEMAYSSEEDGVYLIGDAYSGPSTVVEAIASARKAVEEAIDSVYEEIENSEEDDDEECECGGHHHDGEQCNCGHHHHHDDEDEEDDEEVDEDLRDAEDKYFASILEKKIHRTKSDMSLENGEFFKREAKRCLECSYICSKCVDVCPNRANVAIDMRAWEAFEDPFEIVHLDAYCNECGNCETFCPYSGGPYKKKFTIFSLPEDFEKSENDGFYFDGEGLSVRYEGEILKGGLDKEGLVEVEGLPAELEMLIDEIFTSYHYLLGIVEE